MKKEKMVAEGNAIIAEFKKKIEAFEKKYGGMPNVYIDVIAPLKSTIYPYRDCARENKCSFHYKEIDFQIWHLDKRPIKVLNPEQVS